jgi:ketosteroid isomerase-like protein
MFWILPLLLAAAAPAHAAASPKAPEAKHSTESDARAFLDAWLKAQNTGSFDAYAAFYAPNFRGIKRTGAKTFEYDHDGWLADRKKMFAKKMTVGAEAVEIHAGPNAAQILFTQNWASATYKDSGRKEMVVSRDEGDVLRIEREELLNSEPGKTSPVAEGKGPFAPVFELDGDVFLVLDENTDHASDWTKGDPSLVEFDPSMAAARQEVKAGAPPAADRAWVGRAVTLYGRDGQKTCTGTVSDIALLARVRGMPDDEDEGGEESDEPEGDAGRDGDDSKDADRAANVFAMGTSVLVGELAPDAGARCTGALWARSSSLPAPAIWSKLDPDPALETNVIAKLRTLSGWLEIQKDFANVIRNKATVSTWDEFHHDMSVVAFRDPAGTRTFVWAGSSPSEDCSDFPSDFWAVFELKDKSLTLLTDGSKPGDFFRPEVAFDFDADGWPELLSLEADEVVGHVAGAAPGGIVYDRRFKIDLTNYGDPCQEGD